jgi:hypothetical protein
VSKTENQPPKQRKVGQAIKFRTVAMSEIHLARAKHMPISRSGQCTLGRVKAHTRHHKHI